MIVDEHEMVVASLEIMFEDYKGIEVCGRAINGAQAIEMAGQLLPDVILMDLMMPVMDGLTATKIIRQQHPQIKIVILTASTLEADKDAALAAGAHAYIGKDCTSGQLIDTIRETVRI